MIDKKTPIPVYEQIRQLIQNDIISGVYPPGSMLPTEAELGQRFGVSRYPMRQAMTALVNEGLLERVRGKGTFVSNRQTDDVPPKEVHRIIALVMPELRGDYANAIIEGFVNNAANYDFAVLVSISRTAAEEQMTVERMVRAGASCVVLFPASSEHDSSHLKALMEDMTNRGIYISLIDRNPGLEHIDFISTDNAGGGYMAARHIHLQGYRSAAFIGNTLEFSSVQERLHGFQRGLRQYGLTLLNPLIQGLDHLDDRQMLHDVDFSSTYFCEHLEDLRAYLPFGVFCENDNMALLVMDELRDKGFEIGEEIGVVGFDNISAGKYQQPPLTTISQNGILIGETAAEIAISRVLSGSKQSVRQILPTQVIIRKSCGEAHARS